MICDTHLHTSTFWVCSLINCTFYNMNQCSRHRHFSVLNILYVIFNGWTRFYHIPLSHLLTVLFLISVIKNNQFFYIAKSLTMSLIRSVWINPGNGVIGLKEFPGILSWFLVTFFSCKVYQITLPWAVCVRHSLGSLTSLGHAVSLWCFIGEIPYLLLF